MVIMKALPPDRLHVFGDAKYAVRLLRDGWCIGHRRMMVIVKVSRAAHDGL